jgi:hypothetical protein
MDNIFCLHIDIKWLLILILPYLPVPWYHYRTGTMAGLVQQLREMSESSNISRISWTTSRNDCPLCSRGFEFRVPWLFLTNGKQHTSRLRCGTQKRYEAHLRATSWSNGISFVTFHGSGDFFCGDDQNRSRFANFRSWDAQDLPRKLWTLLEICENCLKDLWTKMPVPWR